MELLKVHSHHARKENFHDLNSGQCTHLRSYRISLDRMGWTGLLSIPILLHTYLSPVASEPQCAVIPYGRPEPGHCAYILNHMIPSDDEPSGYVTYSPAAPFIRLPLIYYFRQLPSDYLKGLY